MPSIRLKFSRVKFSKKSKFSKQRSHMQSGSLMIDFKPGVPPLVLKIDQGKTSTNIMDIASAALIQAKAARSPEPGIVEFLTEWIQSEDTKEFAEKAAKNPPPVHTETHATHSTSAHK